MMNKKFFFQLLIPLFFLNGCNEKTEDLEDLDKMVMSEEEDLIKAEEVLAGEPIPSPQEMIIKENPDVQVTEDQRP